MVDDIVLWAQALVDRLARWARLRRPVPREGRRFLIVQIDGLPRDVLERGLPGRAPAIARLLGSGRLKWRDLSVGLPTSTPFFQAALMYGVHPDIPGFHWYDKRERADRYFPRVGVADLVEQRASEGRRGILAGGACYGCVFTGGASDSLWTMTRLLRPTRAGAALLTVPLSALLLAWVVLKCMVLTVAEVGLALLRLIADPVREGHRGIRWLALKIGLSIWARQLFTLAVSSELYRGTPAVYVNYLEYDVFAHAFGPHHPLALRALRRVDRSIAQLDRILRRMPERQYDLYVLSDHGQAATRPFERVSGGVSIERHVLALLAGKPAPPDNGASKPNDHEARRTARLLRCRGFFQRFLNYLEWDFHVRLRDARGPGAPEGVRVVAAGPNAFVYFTDSPEPLTAEEIERRYPGLPAMLSGHPGIGFVLGRSVMYPLCWYRGRQVSLGPESRGGPFDQRPDREIVLTGLRELMLMPGAGDLVLYGIGAPAGDVSFLHERGAHAGPSEAELHTFILHPSDVALPGQPLTHPAQLYGHFAAYADQGRA